MKIRFNSGDNLSPKKTLKRYKMIIIVRSVLHEGNKNYSQVS